jgi:hypothetical protein
MTLMRNIKFNVLTTTSDPDYLDKATISRIRVVIPLALNKRIKCLASAMFIYY